MRARNGGVKMTVTRLKKSSGDLIEVVRNKGERRPKEIRGLKLKFTEQCLNGIARDIFIA